MRLKVPGNLLLLGEFAVTLEGGLGIACSVDRFVTIEVKESDRLKISSSHGEHLIRFTLERLFGTLPPLDVFVDSTPLFRENGEKMGLGSSAAVVAGLTRACLKNSKPIQAIEIHREYQGGRGSGYDVAVSFMGCDAEEPFFGQFTGGKIPSFEILGPLTEKIHLVSGKRPVSTVETLKRFEQLENKVQFLEESNKIVSKFLKTNDLHTAFREGKAFHEELHRAMGVERDFPELEEMIRRGGIGKALGSGYELGAILLDHNS